MIKRIAQKCDADPYTVIILSQSVCVKSRRTILSLFLLFVAKKSIIIQRCAK